MKPERQSFYFFKLELIFSVVLISAVQQGDAGIHIYRHSCSYFPPWWFACLEKKIIFPFLCLSLAKLKVSHDGLHACLTSSRDIRNPSLKSYPSLCDAVDCSPWDSPGKNTGVGCHALLQGIFPTQGIELKSLHWQVSSLTLSQQRSPLLSLPGFSVKFRVYPPYI